MDPLGCCALSLAAALGHTRTLAALLDAGATPNPGEPSGRPMWPPLAAAALACGSGNLDAASLPLVPEAAALAMCELLLARGADVTACLAAVGPASQWRRASWLLQLEGRALQRLLLRELLAAVRQGRLRPNFELGGVLLLLAAQADCAAAFGQLAAALPAGRLPAEYCQLAEEAVATARCCLGGGGGGCSKGRASGDSSQQPGEVLRCMAQLAAASQRQRAAEAAAMEGAGDQAPATAVAASPDQLARHLGCELAACLAAAALDGQRGQLEALLRAGVPVTAAAITSAVHGGSLGCLALLLQHGAPPANPLPADTVLRIPSSAMHGPPQYPCPMLALLATHAAQVGGRAGVEA